ncbi:MAG: NAD(P)-binding protein [Woeseiaceae bacterium]|nr:NAD(P)-binding protein [Woeseiaceae bacterium]
MDYDFDAIVIGAGRNGLTAAGYLDRADLRTLVLERRHVVGGAAVTEEFHPCVWRIPTLRHKSKENLGLVVVASIDTIVA